MDDPRISHSDEADEGPVELDEPVETMSLRNSLGTAVGAAMLGFEQALRKEPPAEVLAAEHMPERDRVTSGEGELVLEFPAPIERKAET